MYGNYSSWSREISIIDCKKMTVAGTIDVSPAEAPHDLALDEQKDLLWVTVEKVSPDRGGGLLGIDLGSQKVVKRIEYGANTIHWFIMTRDGKKAYRCNKEAPFVSVISLEEERMVGKIEVPGAEQPGVSRCGRYLLFPTPNLRFGSLPPEPKITIIDTETDQVSRTVPLEHGYGPAGVHVTSTGEVMVSQYCFDTEAEKPTPVSGRVSLFDAKCEKLLGHFKAGAMPLTMRSTSDGSMGFVAMAKGGTVNFMDLKTMKIIRTLDVDVVPCAGNKHQPAAHGMALSISDNVKNSCQLAI